MARRRTPAPLTPIVGAYRLRSAVKERRRADRDVSPELAEVRHLRAELTALRTGVDPNALTEEEKRFQAWAYRRRKPLAAVYVGVALAVSKVLLFAPSILPAIGVLGVVVLAGGAVLWVRSTGDRPLPTLVRASRGVVPDEYGRWVDWALTPRAGAAGISALAALWWAVQADPRASAYTWVAAVTVAAVVRGVRFRIRPPEPTPEPAGGVATDWAEFIAAQEKEAAGSEVVAWEDVHRPDGDRLGFRAGVVMPKGSKGATVVAPALRPRIRTTFGVGVQDVMVDVDRSNDQRFTFTVLDEPGSNALEFDHIYEGSDFDPTTGIWTQGPRADWSGGQGRLYDPDVGGFNIHVSGETGGGKSEGIETLLRSVTAGGVVIPLIVDLGQATFTDWAPRVPIFVRTPERAVQLLRNYNALIQHRNRDLGTLRNVVDGEDLGPRRVYPIDRDHPAYLLVFDEWQFAIHLDGLGAAILKETEGIVTQQRKVVCPMLLAGQVAGLIQGFKNSHAVRTQCQAGTMIAFKNNSEAGGQVFGGSIKVDTSTIPLDIKGACFMTSNIDARDAMMRSQWVRYPTRTDHEIDIPEAPAHELAILTRGLPGGLTVDQDAPVVVEQVPPQRVEAFGPSDELMAAILGWLEEAGPRRRGDIVAEFRDARGMGSSTKIDDALKRMREAGILASDNGTYTPTKVDAR